MYDLIIDVRGASTEEKLEIYTAAVHMGMVATSDKDVFGTTDCMVIKVVRHLTMLHTCTYRTFQMHPGWFPNGLLDYKELFPSTFFNEEYYTPMTPSLTVPNWDEF